MPNNKHYILSTRPLAQLLIDKAAQQNIIIEQLSFIETQAIKSTEVSNQIKNTAQKSTAVVFTSMNAVDAVAEELNSSVNWKVYCIGNTTRKLVEEKFGERNIAGTAENATALANVIINDFVKDIVFFCGNQRRDELPQQLKNNHITINEVVVYQTIETPYMVSKKYDGILFFSPSAVHSFFSANKEFNSTQYFAIGKTTAETVQQYTNQNVIIADTPAKENLVQQVIAYFSTHNTQQQT